LKKPAARKSAKKSAARKKSPAKKTATKKAAAKKASAKKSPAKKAAKKKAPAKKASPKKAAPKKRTARKAAAKAESPAQKALAMITKILDDDQADNIAVIDLAGKSVMADYMVIASGRNPRHIGAMAQHLRDKIKSAAGVSPPVEGMNSAEWVLVDQGDVVVHLFRPETRQLYNLEKMWGAAMAPDDEDADPRRL
jgi:ribosome-associated protein